MSEAPEVLGPPWPWSDKPDAVLAAQRRHRALFENERARVPGARIAPGDTAPIHTHR
jgi:hypothetical protein